MTTRVFLLAVLFGGIALVSAPAQQPNPPKSTLAPKTETAADPMSEEIEIMRRLLDRALEKQQHAQVATWAALTNATFSADGQWLTVSPYNSTNLRPWNSMSGNPNDPMKPWSLGGSPSIYPSFQPTFQPNLNTPYTLNHWIGNVSAPHAPPELRAAQGVYLKGYGVVYTATLALPTAPPVADAKKPTTKPLTDWERTRQELHGEKAEPAKTTPQDTLADAVLKILAKNGQHFSQLADTEQITVALTLPRSQSCTQCHVQEKSGTQSKTDGSTSTSGSSGSGTSTGSSSNNPMGGTATKDFIAKVNALKKDAEKAALLGDLHLKQGKNEQAVTSFQEALKLYFDASEALHRGRLKDAQLEQDLVATAAKVVQALTAQGKMEEARATLKLLAQHLQDLPPTEAPSKAPEAPAKVELPAKLVISAPKKLLDLVGADKITFDEFRKNATVDYQPARTIEKQPAKP